MDRRLGVTLALAALVVGAYAALAAPPAPPQERAFTLEAVAFACPYGDGVCLAYDAATPGPTLDVNLGDVLVVTLVNRIAETLPPGAPAHLADASVSWHVHGTALAASMDGVAAHEGTRLVASVAPPGGSFTYRVRAAFAGAWHYHDHVLGMDGDEGVKRGLYGSLVVRPRAEPRPDVTLDLHLVDAGANGGRGLDANVAADQHVELLVVGLDNVVWNVTLRDPSGALLGARDVGPGMSERFVVGAAAPGVYKWRAVGLGVKTGEVRVS